MFLLLFKPLAIRVTSLLVISKKFPPNLDGAFFKSALVKFISIVFAGTAKAVVRARIRRRSRDFLMTE